MSTDSMQSLLATLRRESPGPAEQTLNLLGHLLRSESAPAKGDRLSTTFFPEEPASLEESGLSEFELSALIIKAMLHRQAASSREIAQAIRMPGKIVGEALGRLKADQQLVYKGSTSSADFICELTTVGRESAKRLSEHSSYCGSAPVPIEQYIGSVQAQSPLNEKLTLAQVHRAFQDMRLPPRIINQLAQAMHACRALFLYGASGNGKTMIAERISRTYGQAVWIPRAILVDGEIVRLFDITCHEEIPLPASSGLLKEHHIDARWVRIRRPTVIAGGEMTLDRLEVAVNHSSGTLEAPLQLKSNCGTLVIDDFGRQRVAVADLLNRWIVPLEKRFDIFNLPSGQAVQIPFEQLIVFSTNLQPKDLADEAFLRRIPYKVDVVDPTNDQFHEAFAEQAAEGGFAHSKAAVDYLLDEHYRKASRPLRWCHIRDLMLQIKHFCSVCQLPLELTPRTFDIAVRNYFGAMGQDESTAPA